MAITGLNRKYENKVRVDQKWNAVQQIRSKNLKQTFGSLLMSSF